MRICSETLFLSKDAVVGTTSFDGERLVYCSFLKLPLIIWHCYYRQPAMSHCVGILDGPTL